MKQSTEDQAKGKFHEVKGKVKESVGKATNNPRLQDEGAASFVKSWNDLLACIKSKSDTIRKAS